MLEKLIRKFPRPDRSHPALARVDAIRQWVAAHLTGRHRYLVAAAAAVALAGAVSLAAHAAVTDPPPASATGQEAADAAAIAERQAAAERADRAQREEAESREAGEARAANPEESPEPEPEPAPAETEPASEPEPAAEPEPEPEPEPAPAQQPDWVHPMPGASTTSCYGMRWGALHAGVDLAAPHGTPIRAVGAGTVTNAGWVFGGYGISVVVDHGNGFLTHYAHASEATVSVGQQVSAGQTIALEGSTGDSTGPHLHFEVHQGLWSQIEPTSWMRDRGVTIGGC